MQVWRWDKDHKWQKGTPPKDAELSTTLESQTREGSCTDCGDKIYTEPVKAGGTFRSTCSCDFAEP